MRDEVTERLEARRREVEAAERVGTRGSLGSYSCGAYAAPDMSATIPCSIGPQRGLPEPGGCASERAPDMNRAQLERRLDAIAGEIAAIQPKAPVTRTIRSSGCAGSTPMP